MALQRRKFLKSGILFAASAALAVSSVRSGFAQKTRGRVSVKLEPSVQIPTEAQLDPVFQFTRATFDPYVGGFFQAPNARGEKVSLKLLKAESYKPQSNTKLCTNKATEAESFSLLFSSFEPLPPFTNIHTIRHGALGEFNLFLTRRNGSNGEIFYEAVFGHVR